MHEHKDRPNSSWYGVGDEQISDGVVPIAHYQKQTVVVESEQGAAFRKKAPSSAVVTSF